MGRKSAGKMAPVGRQKSNMLNHVESVHFPSLFLYECPYCGKAHNTKNALSVHISVKHKLRKY